MTIPSPITRRTLGDRGALFDPTRDHRYLLWSFWSPDPYLCVVGLNPSTADETSYDPTCNREAKRALSAGYGGYVKVNLFSWTDTSPELMLGQEDPGDDAVNDLAIRVAARGCGAVLCGWGVNGTHRGRGVIVTTMLRAIGKPLYHLGLNQGGTPRHPLYVPHIQPMVEWS